MIFATFVSASLEHGMDIKTLSTIIGHVSSSTTLNVYAHVTDEIRRKAAVKIDQGLGKADPKIEAGAAPQKPAPSTFQAQRDSGARLARAVSPRLTKNFGKGDIPPSGRTAKSTPATSMPTAGKNAKNCWQI